MLDLNEVLQGIYDAEGSLETTCCRQSGCCRVACPQMHYSEAILIWNKILSKWTREEKKQFLIQSVRHFFSRSLIKPCPLFGKIGPSQDGCRIYANRPLNCRLYGLLPEDVYAQRVQSLAEKLGLESTQIPLNKQCQWVRRVNGQMLTSEAVSRLDNALNVVDEIVLQNDVMGRQEIGPKGPTKDQLRRAKTEARSKVRKGWAYRTIADWALYFVFGEDFLSMMTQKLLSMSNEESREMMATCEGVIEKAL